MTEVTPKLYLSGRIRSQRDTDLMAAKGIGAVVSLVEDPDYTLPASMACLHSPTADGAHMPFELLDGIFSFIRANMESTKVLVSCSAGVSRSAGIAIGHLMRTKNWTWEKALGDLNGKRPVWPALEVKESVTGYVALRSGTRCRPEAPVAKEDAASLRRLNEQLGFTLPQSDAIVGPARGYVAEGGRVTRLGLCGLGLKAVPPAVFRFRHLTGLYLDENELAELPADIGSLAGLKRLGLSRNRIAQMPEETGALEALEFLNASWNRLETAPESVGLGKLKELYLNNNHFKTMPEALCGLGGLRELYLQHNALSGLPESIGGLVHLTHLGLDANSLEQLPESIGAIRGLRALNLRSNRLQCLPEALSRLRRLDNINLSRNALRALPVSITRLRRLRRFNIGLNENLVLTQAQDEWLCSLKANGCAVVTDRL